jgi:hypothetical protein
VAPPTASMAKGAPAPPVLAGTRSSTFSSAVQMAASPPARSSSSACARRRRAVLQNSAVLSELAPLVSPEDFYVFAHRLIFGIALERFEATSNVEHYAEIVRGKGHAATS